MSILAIECGCPPAPRDRWDDIRATVFWAFILLVIGSPAVLGALILMAA